MRLHATVQPQVESRASRSALDGGFRLGAMSGALLGSLTDMATFTSIDEYITSFPEPVQDVLQEIRRTMHGAVPGAGERISYDIPAITLDDRSLVYFAGWKRHVSVYPIPDGDEDYEMELAPYRSGASTAKFALNKPVPYDLIERITALHRDKRGAAGPQ